MDRSVRAMAASVGVMLMGVTGIVAFGTASSATGLPPATTTTTRPAVTTTTAKPVVPTTTAKPPATMAPVTTVAPVTTTTKPAAPGSALGTRLQSLKLVNYYPSTAAWTAMWTQWNATGIDHDFAAIAALHANAVRIIIQTTTFGYPTPSATMLSRLNQTVALASAHGLAVQLTLFDWWNGYSDLAGSHAWANAVLSPYKGDPRIAFVEVKNEVDPTDPAVMAWARDMIPYVRSVSGLPVTISTSGSVGLAGLRQLKAALGTSAPDFWDAHFYGSPAIAYSALSQAIAIVAPAPLFVGETGAPSGNGPTAPTDPFQEAVQSHYYRSVEWATASLGLPAAAPWTLQDFTAAAVPPAAGFPITSGEYRMGLLRADGSQKPAGQALQSFFGSGAVDTSFNSGFESGSGTLPLEWSVNLPQQGTFAWDRTVAHSGSASVSLSRTGGNSSAIPSFFTSPIVVPLRTGEHFTAGVWAKGQSATGLNAVAIAWFDIAGNYLGNSVSSPLPLGTTGWTHLIVTSAAPANGAYAQVHLASGQNAGTVWFDDVTYQAVD